MVSLVFQSQLPNPKIHPAILSEVPNPDAEVLLEIWSSDVTGDELMSSVPRFWMVLVLLEGGFGSVVDKVP